jgi:SEC-C motif-containing protein
MAETTDTAVLDRRAPSDIAALYAAEDVRRGRNEPCTCGSGRKWKHCHGRTPEAGSEAGRSLDGSMGVPGFQHP